MVYRFALLLAVALMASVSPALAEESAEMPEFTLTIKDHLFTPDALEVPAGKRVKLVVDNQDASPEEFESHKLKAEKVIPGNSKAIIYVGPLEPGDYKFVGEFHESKAKGVITAK